MVVPRSRQVRVWQSDTGGGRDYLSQNDPGSATRRVLTLSRWSLLPSQAGGIGTPKQAGCGQVTQRAGGSPAKELEVLGVTATAYDRVNNSEAFCSNGAHR